MKLFQIGSLTVGGGERGGAEVLSVIWAELAQDVSQVVFDLPFC